ncbi:MAG: dTDP-4-dehydrorhamnose 3,5-epimerase [Flavobacteriales bacterium]|jgi:dTDP-4-dehydrorhamnose 3,5-epimerase|nr:dTDP-4-dehydrorhamnose 3,5-epimerase [Flavobacteriales bacterium]
MTIKNCTIAGLKIIEPKVFEDSRGYFFESFSKHKLAEAGIKEEFLQDNQSLSQKGVLRGLHFQKPPFAQSKLVRVIKGSVLDVAVDLRKKSPTYGAHFKIVLSEENKTQLYIPKGFAHGFLTLEPDTIFSYKCGDYYHKESEDALFWNDPILGIDWGIEDPLVSEKDQIVSSFKDFVSPF